MEDGFDIKWMNRKYKEFSKMELWSLFEAVALITRRVIRDGTIVSVAWNSHRKVFDTAKRSIIARTLSSTQENGQYYVRPLDFLNWAGRSGIHVPPELLSFFPEEYPLKHTERPHSDELLPYWQNEVDKLRKEFHKPSKQKSPPGGRNPRSTALNTGHSASDCSGE